MKRFIDGQRGVTLIELLIVLSLIAIVIGLGYRYYEFGARTFDRGESRAGAQQVTRLATDYILQEIRYAKNMEILDTVPTFFDNDYNYIYYHDGEFTHVKDGTENNVFEHIAQGLDFELDFDKAKKQDPDGSPGDTIPVEGDKTLEFSVNTGEDVYTVESSGYLRHLEGIIEGNNGVGIRYQKHDWSPKESLDVEGERLEEDYSGCC